MTATDRLRQFAAAVANEREAIERRTDTLTGAADLLRETGQTSVRDAIAIAAKREAIRKGATL